MLKVRFVTALAAVLLISGVSATAVEARKFSPAVQAARDYALERIGETQFQCLDVLFERESHWNPKSYNKHSGAYGIPQALPGSKMAKAGKDWKTNPTTQVKWGLMYIKSRYGTACAALNHAYSTGWY